MPSAINPDGHRLDILFALLGDDGDLGDGAGRRGFCGGVSGNGLRRAKAQGDGQHGAAAQ